MKEEIRTLLKNSREAWLLEEIAEELSLSITEAEEELKEMTGEGLAVITKKGRYAAPETLGLAAARVFVLRNGTQMARPIIPGEAMRMRPHGKYQCLPDDLVLVRPEDAFGAGPRMCSLVSILHRAHETFSAVIYDTGRTDPNSRLLPRKKSKKHENREESAASARAYDSRLAYPIRLTGDLQGARDGDMVVLKTAAWPSGDKPLTARVLRVMGEAERLPVQLMALAEDHGFASAFSGEIEAEAAAFPESVQEKDLFGRRNLRHLVLFTIDGEDAKDFDDAVSLEKKEDFWLLGVHIADVSHYVREGQPIDKEALFRGTSLYMPGLTLPMLPHVLSDGLCSLKPGVDRLAMSLFMKVRDGRIFDHELTPSVIHSRARLTYTQVNKLFAGQEADVPPELHGVLAQMDELAKELRHARQKRGSVDFDLPETAFTLGPDNAPVDVHARERGEAERLIEDFMLAANETVAALAKHTGLPLLYRVHEKPDPMKIAGLEVFLGGLGIPARLGPEPHSGMLQELLNKTAGLNSADIIRNMVIRSLKRAHYSQNPEGHYALAAKDYCHFTSPIRRYPDLVVHRMLKRLLAGEGNGSITEEKMAMLAEQSSRREFAATSAEREGDNLLKAVYMSGHIGEEYEGIISGVTAWGLYVMLSNTVEGLVHISTLDDYYYYDPDKSALTGERTNKSFRLGDKVRIKVTGADRMRREVDFELAEKGGRAG